MRRAVKTEEALHLNSSVSTVLNEEAQIQRTKQYCNNIKYVSMH